ncbi:hypothetical protein ACER0C_003033 [Sarotherodon galilaeus]
MARQTETLQVRLQQDPFCIPTGPHDDGIGYPCKVSSFAPVILDSPVVFHLYLPVLFPDEVLKIHAEHLGHFLALQSIPKVNVDLESTLFHGLCRLFTRERVLAVYAQTTGDPPCDPEDLPCGQRLEDYENNDAEPPRVFASFTKSKAKQSVLALLQGLLSLFNKTDLIEKEIPHTPGQEPEHMLFLYLIQLMVVFVSSQMPETDLATIMSVASSVFLETNLRHPLCAATLLKPMFVPYYEQQSSRSKKTADRKSLAERTPRVAGYRLFTGYVLNDKGEDVSTSGDLEWTERSILNRVQGWKLQERDARKLCEFDEPVMATVNFSMTKLSEAIRHQSRNLWSKLRTRTKSCLCVTGVGFAGQDSGAVLHFGRVFTGSEEKRLHGQGSYGTFTSVVLGVMEETMMSNMLFAAYSLQPPPANKGARATLASPYKPVLRRADTVTDVYMYARYHHRLNSGEFTEVAHVKPAKESPVANMLTEPTLTPNSKYQLTAVHGALPMCGLTLALTLRQTMIMVTGFLCVEMARCIYGTKSGDMMTVCRSITALSMCCKFKLPKNDNQETLNTLATPFGKLLKLTGPMFSNASNRGRLDLNALEWLEAEDYRLPEYIRTSLNMLGDTRQLVEKIMRENSLSYNRVVFLSNNSRMSMTQLYENEKGMVHAPLLAMCNMRLFTNSTKSYAACKFSNKGSYYLVNVFSNTCIKTQLYHRDDSSELQCLMRPTQSTVDDVLENIEKEVSFTVPRIDIDRVRMLAVDLSAEDFESLICAIEKKHIQVTGLFSLPSASAKKPSPSPASQTSTRAREEADRSDNRRAEYSLKRKDRDEEEPANSLSSGNKSSKIAHVSASNVARDSYGETEHSAPAELSVVDDSDAECGYDDSD